MAKRYQPARALPSHSKATVLLSDGQETSGGAVDAARIAHEAGVTAVVQPGGSIRDKDSIAACNERDMAMVTTGIRHFKH